MIEPVDLIVGSDLIYSEGVVNLLLHTAARYLKLSSSSSSAAAAVDNGHTEG